MSLYQDRQIKGFLIFLILFALLFVGTETVLTIYQVNDMELLWLKHDEAIGNIVKNALDHTQAGAIVRITWDRTPAMFRIFISDNGSGIAPEDIHHIFKRFYRSKHSLDTQGIELGLPLAKSIIGGKAVLPPYKAKSEMAQCLHFLSLRNCIGALDTPTSPIVGTTCRTNYPADSSSVSPLAGRRSQSPN